MEPLGAEGGDQLGAEHLQRDPAAVLQVLGEVDRRHASPAELALEPVAIRQAACKLLAQVSHSKP